MKIRHLIEARYFENPDVHLLSDDTFIHFTTEKRAKEIIDSGKLLLNPPYKGFGIHAVCAVSTKFGLHTPNVQVTHFKHSVKDPEERKKIVAVLFKTDTLPKIAHSEEVIWDKDVNLINGSIMDDEKAVEMLKGNNSDIYDDTEKDFWLYTNNSRDVFFNKSFDPQPEYKTKPPPPVKDEPRDEWDDAWDAWQEEL